MTPAVKQLRARWKTADGRKRLEVIKDAIVAEQEWKTILEGFPLTESYILKDLRGADLRNADLKEANLCRANLYGANLRGAKLWITDLREANLRESNLREADLRESDLDRADLSDADLSDAYLDGVTLINADLSGANLRRADLSGARLEKAELFYATLSNAILIEADLSSAFLIEANLNGADLSRADLSGTDLRDANLRNANLRNAKLCGTNLTGACLDHVDLSGADLAGCQLVKASLKGANISGAKVFGVSAWEIGLDDKTKQDNLVITDDEDSQITVDDIRIAQFIYLLLNNPNVRDVIDTVAKKVVLILGRFTPERKAVLDAIRADLRARGYCPVLFDFEKLVSRNTTETVSILAHMARFVIADITDAKSIPQELTKIVPHLPSVAVQPLILKGQREYGMFDDLREYPWLLPTYEYDDQEGLICNIGQMVIAPAEAKSQERQQARLQRQSPS